MIVHDLTVAFLFPPFFCGVLVTLLCGFSSQPVPVLTMLPFDRCLSHQSCRYSTFNPLIHGKIEFDVSSETNRRMSWPNDTRPISPAPTPAPPLFTLVAPSFYFYLFRLRFSSLVFLPFLFSFISTGGLLSIYLSFDLSVCPYCTVFVLH